MSYVQSAASLLPPTATSGLKPYDRFFYCHGTRLRSRAKLRLVPPSSAKRGLRSFDLIRLNQHVGRDAEPLVKPPYHLDRQRTLTIQNLGYFRSAAYVRL